MELPRLNLLVKYSKQWNYTMKKTLKNGSNYLKMEYGQNKEIRYTKQNNTHITPDEIIELRDIIATNILNKVSIKIEQALN